MLSESLFRRAVERSTGAAPPAAEAPAAPPGPDTARLLDEAERFVGLFHSEGEGQDDGSAARRMADIRAEVDATGTYTHTRAELAFGARVAWRNSNRCIGRLYWRSLRVRDRRATRDAADIAAESVKHLTEAGGGGRIRPTITVFAPDGPDTPGPRFHNEQLIRYAGYRQPDGTVLGDPMNTGLTELALRHGWPGGPGTRFDVLPLVVETPRDGIEVFELPPEAVLEVELSHPRYPWFAALGLRWHAVPVISAMDLEIGGIRYPAAPFNGWYMGTEIGARNFGDTDRYDMLPVVAAKMALDTSSDTSLWRDRAMVELNVAVLHSFARAGVKITDHHTEAKRFLTHVEREEEAGRSCPADWSWIVPPLSGSATLVFHRYYDEGDLRPNYLHRACPVTQEQAPPPGGHADGPRPTPGPHPGPPPGADRRAADGPPHPGGITG
ncbi:nitric oxide synthase oxygenase [Streptomyces sp. NPDC006784]|uniref:nitric oxide synthase oxygenase n=1 Tax=Streptomyces sp. NPDC006784 TaxID=3364764 RepID=UPI0036B7F356